MLPCLDDPGASASPTRSRLGHGHGHRVEVRRVEPAEHIVFHLAAHADWTRACGDTLPRPMPRYFGCTDETSRHAVTAQVVDMSGRTSPPVGLGLLRPLDAPSSRVERGGGSMEGTGVADVLLYVRPEHRREGVGRALLDAVVELACDLGIRRLRVELSEEQLASLRLLARLSTQPTVRREGARRVVEFPTAAYDTVQRGESCTRRTRPTPTLPLE